MILIDALYINGGGGKVLLDYLIDNLEKTEKEVYYLIDDRIKDKVFLNNSNNVLDFQKADLEIRKKFYKKNKDSFTSVFCLGNLPPNIKMNAIVYTYFHQLLYLELPKEFSVKEKLLFTLKTMVLRYLKKNTDYWMVQTEIMQNRFSKKYNISKNKILLMPFYPPLHSDIKVHRNPLQYCYISNATTHKNHKRLIEAFCKFYDKQKKGKLILTVSFNYPEIFNLIEDKKKKNYPIDNLGFLNREQLINIYKSSEFQIYPSLSESFGLGLIEAIENSCNIIGADLPYTYAVCNPSYIFNPLDSDSIFNTLCLSLQDNYKESSLKVSNEISKLLKLLK